MQRHRGALHAGCVQGSQHRVVKVQRSRGCGHGAGALRKHGLVAAFVVCGVGVVDVGRQRHMAVLLQQLQWVGRQAQVEQAVFWARAAQHLGVKGVSKAHHGTGAW